MQANFRKLILGILLILTLAATGYVYSNDTKESSIPESLTDVNALGRNGLGGIKLIPTPALLQSRFLQDTTQDIFQPKDTIKEPQKEVSPPLTTPPIVITSPITPPAVPTAPPMPFSYIGKYMEDGELVVFLGYRGTNLIVKTGDVIQQTYKVEKIQPPVLAVTYLPMNITQNIQIGELQ